jgi:pimeloyl-ACP methyl ester carboxylesterase
MTTTTAPTTQTVTSADGTRIAYQKAGSGPPLILVDGALCYRAFGPASRFEKELLNDFTVYTYDRRGRGESTNTAPYSVDREIEDIQALIQAAGGSVYLFGQSSGAALALEAANKLGGIEKLATYEAPYVVDAAEPPSADFQETLDTKIAADDRAGALKYFMKTVGTPGFVVTLVSLTPPWKKMKGVAHTLPYDARILGDHRSGKPLPAGTWPTLTTPTLVMVGSKSPAVMHNAQKAIASALPSSTYEVLEGQTHMVKAPVIAPKLTEFFTK